MADNGEQLISFFVYSLFVYPVTNYLVSPQRSYPRWKAALYAVVFLLVVSTLHMTYDNFENGPNHYRLLGVPRDSTLGVIKKSYRTVSLDLHPDKNKSPEAAVEFQRITTAFDILADKEKRREYNRLGDSGVKASTQQVIDNKYLLIQMIVYYVSTVIFAFLMTFSEPTGDAFNASLFGLTVMLFLEMLLVVQEMSMPGWLLPYVTPYEVVGTLHRLFPAFMNGCRCVTGAFMVDRRADRVQVLELLSNNAKDLTMRIANVGRELTQCIVQQHKLTHRNADGGSIEDEDWMVMMDSSLDSGGNSGRGGGKGLMERSLDDVQRKISTTREGRNGTYKEMMDKRVEVISNPTTLRKSASKAAAAVGMFGGWSFWRDLAIYLLARYLFVKAKKL
mmetsp:Transcript_21976/g.36812  ORF Transcript_21976/g.36812 Transcript_21976/m.36812 type:complete len:391 (-) Transcript_21976:117-1289(-)|eukprot:CAMPEP_0174963932 /NCGR_PEP_ID=MMETSP0004_2-20121128/5599_1 /TAXON_ID=420556 /ORGANISM="Ochromonas sp., Strain CCMP1393" /LENGTH=390 /DNA_ID=CAMNT_0016212601 /DNA_START=71 /DNA_END=1243 /DNA_ORIENTATION=-